MSQTLRQTIYEKEQVPISFDEIMKALRGIADPNFILLDELPESPTDEQLFKSKDCVLVLCTVHSRAHGTKFNHWISIIKRPKEYWYYDSLANSIAKLTTLLHNGKRSLVNWAAGKRVRENTVQTQKYDVHVSTCGYHQIVRISRKDLDPKKFIRWLTHGMMEPDLSVSFMCYLSQLK